MHCARANAGGPSTDGKDLGEEFDIVWVIPCTQTTQVDLGMGFFMPGDGFESATGGDDNVVFGYLQFRTGF